MKQHWFRNLISMILISIPISEPMVVLAPVDVFLSTVDPLKEPPRIMANTVRSILVADYPVDKVSCYVSDDGAAMLTFEALSETSEFARKWVPFCKKYLIEPRAPGWYFSRYLRKKVHPAFVRERRAIKRDYEEFKIRINGLAATATKVPEEGWTMQDRTPWPGNNVRDHPGMIQISSYASILFMALFISIAATSLLEMQWGHVQIDDMWRNEQFWVIGGVSSHLFALVQGLLKVLAGVNTNFTVTSKAADDGEFSDLYLFKWTSLLIPPMTLLIMNMIGIVVGISDAISNGYESWGPLFGRLFFAIWVIMHLYPFLKGIMGKSNGLPTIIIVWSILLASILSLLWVRVNPFTSRGGIVLEVCGLDCN